MSFGIRRYRVIHASLAQVHRQLGLSDEVSAALLPLMNIAVTKHELLNAIQSGVPRPDRNVTSAILKSADRFSKARLQAAIASRWSDQIASSRFVVPWLAYILLRPIPFTLFFRARYWWFVRRNNSAVRELLNSNVKGFEHNRKQIASFITGHRERTELFAILLKCIRNLDLTNARTLCVGPRNEAEPLLLKRHGFEKVEAIDLFSYSPLIKVMDMNELLFPDNNFDIYYSAFVLGYSPDIRRTLSEAIRVTKSGGLLVFGFTSAVGVDTYGLTPTGSDIKNFQEFETRLGKVVDHIYWKDSWQVDDQVIFTIILRIRK